MIILTVRTDREESELGLYKDTQQLSYVIWPAHRQLAETIHLKLASMLANSGHTLQTIEGIIIYKGPGSFTGLRIGFSVANALADSLICPIVSSPSDSWISLGIARLQAHENEMVALPEYGALPHITQPKK